MLTLTAQGGGEKGRSFRLWRQFFLLAQLSVTTLH